MAYNTIAGPMTITIPAYGQLEVEGDHTWNLGEFTREEKLGPNGEFHGFKETPQLGMISGTIALTETFTKHLKSFLGGKDMTATVVLPNGAVFTLLHAFQSGSGEGSTENGTIKYELKGAATLK